MPDADRQRHGYTPAIPANDGTVKRDPAAARYWAERAVNNPANDESRGNLLVLLGRLLVKSDKPDERARGLDLLERLSKGRQFGAKTQLALAIRNVDPVRARSLLEQSRRPDPGGRDPALGGNADRRRRRPSRAAARPRISTNPVR
jgi:hypothetical protein